MYKEIKDTDLRIVADHEKIKEIFSQDKVIPAVTKMVKTFKGWPGKEIILGITTFGLIVGVKEDQSKGIENPSYFRVFALDTSLPANKIKQDIVECDLSYLDLDVIRSGGREFPGALNRKGLKHVLEFSTEEVINRIKELNPGIDKSHIESTLKIVTLYKKIEGFWTPKPAFRNTSFAPSRIGYEGKHILYPLRKFIEVD